MTDKEKILSEIATRKLCTMDEHMAFYNDTAKEDYRLLSEIEELIKALQEEPVSEDLNTAAKEYANNITEKIGYRLQLRRAVVYGAKWQEKQDQSTIELAEDHAYFAGRTKTIDEIKKALLSEVLPCFMHGGEADEVVAKLDEVLNQKK